MTFARSLPLLCLACGSYKYLNIVPTHVHPNYGDLHMVRTSTCDRA